MPNADMKVNTESGTVDYSIIVPVYNVAPYLEQCVRSVLNQTFSDFELILIDDGSADESGAICDQFMEEDARIRVIHQKNGGLSAARNTGISLACGEYILFLDSDDYWFDSLVLEKIDSRLRKTNAQVLSFNYVKVTGRKMSAPYFNAACVLPEDVCDTLQFLVDHNIWIACAWNKVLRRDLFSSGDLLFRERITSEDVDWCVRLAIAASRFDFTPDVVVCYRQREESISRSISASKVEVLLDNIDRCLRIMDASEKGETLKPYVGYQLGTVLFHLALLPMSQERCLLTKRTGQYRQLLKWSKAGKIRLLNLVAAVSGIKGTVLLVKLKNKL